MCNGCERGKNVLTGCLGNLVNNLNGTTDTCDVAMVRFINQTSHFFPFPAKQDPPGFHPDTERLNLANVI